MVVTTRPGQQQHKGCYSSLGGLLHCSLKVTKTKRIYLRQLLQLEKARPDQRVNLFIQFQLTVNFHFKLVTIGLTPKSEGPGQEVQYQDY